MGNAMSGDANSVNGIISSMHVASDQRLYYLFLNRS